MTLGNELMVEGILAGESVDGEPFECLTLTAHPIFTGIINPAASIDPRLELGSDVREYSTIEVRNDQYPDGIMQETRIRQNDADGQPIWRIVKREMNPSDPTVRLWVVRVIPGVDQT